MTIVKQFPAPQWATKGEPVRAMAWRPLYANSDPFPQQQIGRYDQPPLTSGPTALYTGVQRRSGWPSGNPRRFQPLTGLPNWQQTQQVGNFPGVQRASKTFSYPQMSRYEVAAQRNAITQQQVAQSGAAVTQFMAAVNKGHG